MESTGLGKVYQDGEAIVRQGEPGDCMYVVQEGRVEIVSRTEQGEVQLALLGTGEFFGEMALFERSVRSATVRAVGPARVLTIDKKNLLRRVHEDPSLAFHLIQTMSSRLRMLGETLAEISAICEGRGAAFGEHEWVHAAAAAERDAPGK